MWRPATTIKNGAKPKCLMSRKIKWKIMAAKVFIVKYESQADYKVCFVDYENQQRNHQIIAGGKLVNYESQADCKVFIVKYELQADIKILRKNFPK